jgi:hypothetical protein
MQDKPVEKTQSFFYSKRLLENFFFEKTPVTLGGLLFDLYSVVGNHSFLDAFPH